ncbi:hypothetical protein NECAME_02533 [Necator americanus]|uniref:Uncharacterized protein n=1 Tax=Necator americanus TaxID=51031 RepID=W2TCD0_NECAM|nr:hypothetical protein NECAME_02533 [Necator americanus]ETN79710.1 hypothetical protein NECAME_02533 [Necator americanus]
MKGKIKGVKLHTHQCSYGGTIEEFSELAGFHQIESHLYQATTTGMEYPEGSAATHDVSDYVLVTWRHKK